MNFKLHNKTVKKVGEGKYGNYGCRVAIVGGKKVLRGLKRVGVAGVVGISEVRLPKIFMRLSLVRFTNLSIFTRCDLVKMGLHSLYEVGLRKIRSKVQSCSSKLKIAVFMAMVAAAWAVMPAGGAEAAFRLKTI